MSNQYLIKYSKFDDILDSVRDDFENYEAEGYIDASKLIKVVKTINKKLGLKLNKEDNSVLDIVNNKAKLPSNFYKLNYAIVFKSTRVVQPRIQGRYTEEVWVQLGCDKESCNQDTVVLPNDSYTRGKICVNSCNNIYTIMERRVNDVIEYTESHPCKIKSTSSLMLNDGCMSDPKSEYEITIQNDVIYTNFDEGVLYINYLADLIDDDNNLLILDHPMVNEYYEYALKRRILENIYLDKGEEVQNKLTLIEQRYREAKKTAHRLVDTPEYNELQKIWRDNRKTFDNYWKFIY